jgi:hypothetical protein
MFSDGKFLLRKKFLYDKNNEIELRYDKEGDKVPWSVTETTYRGLNQSQDFDWVSEVCWKTVGPVESDTTETDEIYFRDVNGLLEKIETYSRGELKGVTKFTYKYY